MKFDLDYAKQVIESESEAIKGLAEAVGQDFARAAEMIYNCSGSAIVSGIGKAGIIAQKISATLASTGTPSHFLHPAEAVHGDLGRLRKEDIVLVLSYGGETDEILRLINLVKQIQIPLIAIPAKRIPLSPNTATSSSVWASSPRPARWVSRRASQQPVCLRWATLWP
jgi:arabinose-5-phosphate isomerase